MIINRFIVYYYSCWMFVNAEAFLIRPNDVYINLIKEVYDHSQARSLVLLHATPGLHQTQDISTTTRLVQLQRAFNKFYIFVTITDIEPFVSQLHQNYRESSLTLFVFLNDMDCMKKAFSSFLESGKNVAHYRWLMFLDDNTKIDSYFGDMYIPLSCNFVVARKNSENSQEEVISEIYNIREDTELISNVISKWSPDSKFKLRNISIARSRNLQGHHFQISTILVTGIVFEVMDLFQSSMNFSPIISKVDLRSAGSLLEQCHELLEKKKTDLILTVNYQYNFSIGYSHDVTPTTVSIYMNTPPKSLVWNQFFQPFASDIWIILGSFIFFFGAVLSLFMFVRQKLIKNRFLTKKKSSHVVTNFFTVYSIMCDQFQDDGEAKPASIKIILLTISGTMVIIFAAYSAVLTSSIASNTFKVPFETFEEFLEDGTWSLNFPLYSNQTLNRMRPIKDERLQKIFDRVSSMSLKGRPTNLNEGFRFACAEPKYAYVTPNKIIQLIEYDDCVLRRMRIPVTTHFYCLLQSNSQFQEIVNVRLIAFIEFGLSKRVFRNMTFIERFPTTFMPVEMVDVLPLLIFMTAAIVLAIVIACIEKMIYTRKGTSIAFS